MISGNMGAVWVKPSLPSPLTAKNDGAYRHWGNERNAPPFGNGTGNVYFDQTRPLGKLLIDFEVDSGKEWNRNLMRLSESYGKAIPFEVERWKSAAPVSGFLRGKYESGEPSAIFAAIRTWDEYLR